MSKAEYIRYAGRFQQIDSIYTSTVEVGPAT